MMLASRTSRLRAQILDTFVAFAPGIPVALLVTVVPEPIWRVLALGVLLFIPAYILFADALPGGQSYGKRAVGIAVVDARTGAPCTPGQSGLRNLTLGLLGFFDWVFIFGEKHRRLGDMAAQTVVVDAATFGAGTRYHGRESPRACTTR